MIDLDLSKRAIAEDLQGGVDITSHATISAESESTVPLVGVRVIVVGPPSPPAAE